MSDQQSAQGSRNGAASDPSQQGGLLAWISSLKDAVARRTGDAVGRLPVRDWVNVSAQPTRLMGFDQTLVWVVLTLLSLGLVMVYSASIALPEGPKFAKYATTHFFSRHLFSLVLALSVAAIAAQIPMSVWERAAPWLFILSARESGLHRSKLLQIRSH